MALNHSPSIVTNGLAFAYDMANIQKSWKGKPTTNIILDPTNWTTGNWALPGCTAVANNAIAPDGTNTASTITSTGGDPWPYQIISVTGGVTYTASVYIRARSQTVGKTGMLWLWFAGTATGTNTFSPTYTLTSAWQRITVTFTPTTSGTVHYRNDIVDTNPVAGDACDLWGAQVEIGSYATPFISGTRSTTNNIVDLTGTNTVTANSLTYASDNTFSFDGNANYIQTTTNCGITGSITLSAWIKPSYSGQTGPHSTIISTDIDYPYGAKLMNYKNTARYGIWLGFSGVDNYEAFVAADINDNTIKLLTASWNQATGVVNIYLNGVLTSTQSTGKTIPVVLSTGKITLGTDYNSIGSANKNKFLGNIYNASIYNRALSAAEVLQNFNALRGRYFGYQQLTYTASSNVTLTNNGTQDVSMFKNADNNVWNGEVRSTEAFTAPCTIEFSKQAASGDNGASYAMIGWNEDPTLNTIYTSLDHASYPYRTDSYSVYNNGSQVLFTGTWDVNKRFYIVYDTDGFIRHYNGSTLLYSANCGTNKNVYVDSSFYSVNSTFGGFSNVKVARSSWNGTNYV